MRPVLMGEVAMDAFRPAEPHTEVEEPWSSFAAARDAWRREDRAEATRIWDDLAHRAEAESRVTLQAWYFLRGAGVPVPGDEARRVLGVVAEVAVGEGHDLLSCYPDGGVRFYAGAGGGQVLEGLSEAGIVQAREAVLQAAEVMVAALGPWEHGELPPLPPGHTRVTVLTPSGPHFGQGPTDLMFSDGLGGPMLAAATQLLVVATELGPGSER